MSRGSTISESTPATWVAPAADAPPFGDYFRAELKLNMTDLNAGLSEAGSGEILLFPILREVWKTYRQDLSLFSHIPLNYDADLSGVPDYLICPLSRWGRLPEPPHLLVVEAKLDDFERAWGQCLAAMVAARKINDRPDLPVYGMTTNGKAWEVGVLRGREFTSQEPTAIRELDVVNQNLHAVFRACRDAALASAA